MRLATHILPLASGQEAYLRRDTTVRPVAAIDQAVSALAPESEAPWLSYGYAASDTLDVR